MEPSPELEDLTRQLAQAICTGDTAFLTRHLAKQAPLAFLGTDPEEWWTDVATLNQTLAAQHQAGVEVIPGDPLAYQEGTVGWAVDRTLRFRREGQEVPFRLTVLYQREEGAWKLVHFHASVGVANEDALGVAL